MEKSFEVGYELVQPLTDDLVNKLAVIVGHCDLLREHMKTALRPPNVWAQFRRSPEGWPRN